MEKKSVSSALPKNDKQNLKRDCPAPYSVILIKSSKELFLTKCGDFFIKRKPITLHQSSFKPGDFCINQVLSINHKIYKSFNDKLKFSNVFLHISKAFDKVWRKEVIFKLNQNNISGDLLNILR